MSKLPYVLPGIRGRQVRVRRTSGPDSSAGWMHRTRDKHGLNPSQGRSSSITTTQLHFHAVQGDARAS